MRSFARTAPRAGAGMLLAALLGACAGGDPGVARLDDALNVIDESDLNDIMLTVADPGEAVAHFQRTAAEHPERIEVQRGLAESLIRAGRPTDAVPVWRRVGALPGATAEDGVSLADALIRSNDWAGAKAVLVAVPPTHETYGRYRLEAMVADSEKKWDKADSFYETAAGLTTTPAGVYNNWGFSKLTRGDYPGAEALFLRALEQDRDLFTAKNNLVLARGAQRRYELPIVSMSQTERAQLLHTMALSAIKQGDVSIGRGLLKEAVETHPQHFEPAARALAALDGNVVN